MTEIKTNYNKIIYNIINRNGGTRRWPNLQAVDIDVYVALDAEMCDWTKIDYRYDIFQDDESIAKKRIYDVPSHFAFYMDSLHYTPEIDHDRFYARDIDYRPCIAFTGESKPCGELKIKTMCRGDDFDEYDLVMSCKELDIMLENLINIINKIYPGLYPIKVEDTPECEEKLCKLLDLIYDFTTILRVKEDEKILEHLYIPVDIQDPYVDLYDELGYDFRDMDGCFEEKPEWLKYDYQHLCLLCILQAFNGEEYFLGGVKEMMKEHKFVLDDFTLYYLKEHETSIENGLDDLKEIYVLCGGNKKFAQV